MGSNRVSTIRNIRTLKALRGDALSIDLGATFTGTLEAWMKKSPDDSTYRPFTIVDGRYLTLTAAETSDYYSGTILTQAVEGKWYFDVEWTNEGGDTETIYTGSIVFYNDVTGSNGVQSSVYTEVLQTPYTISINQTAHGLVVGDVIKFGGNYTKAQASSKVAAGAIGIVASVEDVDNFTYQFGGVYIQGSYTVGADYYLSATTAGLAVTTAPTTDGQYVQYLGKGLDEGLLINIDYGYEVGLGDTPTLSEVLTSGNTTGASDINIENGQSIIWDAVGYMQVNGSQLVEVYGTNGLNLQSDDVSVTLTDIVNISGTTELQLNLSRLSTAGLTGAQTHSLPDASGILALTTDIPSASSLQDVTDIGNETTNDIRVVAGGKVQIFSDNLNTGSFNSRLELNVEEGSTGTTVAHYNKYTRTGSTAYNDYTVGQYISLKNSTDNQDRTYGNWTNTVYDGSGEPRYIIGTFNEAFLSSTNAAPATDILLITGLENYATVTDTAFAGSIDYILGSRSKIIFDNPTAVAENSINLFCGNDLRQGTYDTWYGAFIEINQTAGTTISDGAYLLFDVGIDEVQARTNGVYALESRVDLPSYLRGELQLGDGTYIASIENSGTQTADITLTLPNQTGTLALVSDIPGGTSYGLASQIPYTNATADGFEYSDALKYANDALEVQQAVKITSATNPYLRVEDSGSGDYALYTEGDIEFKRSGSVSSSFLGTPPTSGYLWALPADSGIIALTSDLNALDLQGVTDIGNYTTNDIILKDDVVVSSGTNTSISALQLVDSSGTFIIDGVQIGDIVKNIDSGDTTTVSGIISNNTIGIAVDIFTTAGNSYTIINSQSGTITKAALSADAIWTFPDASGTVALLSDFSNYVDLTSIQTITGDKTFDGDVTINQTLQVLDGLSDGVNTFLTPSSTGTLALLSDITVSGLQAVTDVGSTTTNSITLQNSSLVFNNGSFDSTIVSGSPASNTTIILPSSSGTLALTSDITSVTLQQVTSTGNSTNDDIKLLDSDLIFDTGTYTANIERGLMNADIVLTLPTVTGTFALISDLPSTPTLQEVSDAGAITNTKITVTDIDVLGNFGNGVNIYTLPSSAGTLALTSDIPTTYIQSVVAGANVTINNADPFNPIISATGGGGGVGTLQQVTDLGNTTTNSIEVADNVTKHIQVSNSPFTNGVYLDNTGYINSVNGNNYIDIDPINNWIVGQNTNTNNTRLIFPVATALTNNINIPDDSGTLALLSDVPTNADYVDRTTNQSIDGLKSFGDDITLSSSKIIYDNGVNTATLENGTVLTANRLFYFPDESGVLALESNVPNVDEWATFTGTRAGSNLTVTLGDYDQIGNGTRYVLSDFGSFHSLFGKLNVHGRFQVYNDADTFFIDFDANSLTASRNISWPDNSGTVALLSDIVASDPLGYSASGTAIGGNLEVIIGDFGGVNNGTMVYINDSNSSVSIGDINDTNNGTNILVDDVLNTIALVGNVEIPSTKNIIFNNPLDAFSTTLSVTTPTVNRTISFPNASGVVALVGDSVDSVVAGTGISVDNTDPANPIVSTTASAAPTEEEIFSTVVEPTIVAGAYTFDVTTSRSFVFSITENTTLSAPTLSNSTACTWTAYVTGNFTLNTSAFTVVPSSDTYNGAVANRLIFDAYKTAAGTQVIYLTIENLA